MSDKKSVWELLLKDSASSKMHALNGAADKMSSAFVGVQDRINKTEISLGGVGNKLSGIGGGFNALAGSGVLAGGAIAAIGAGLYKAGELAVNFETGMAKINATAQLGGESFTKLHDRLQDIGSHSGGNFELVPEAYEKILSQTGKVNLSLDILETSLKGAQAGLTDVDMVASAVAQTLSIVGEKNTTANEVMDTLLKAKAVGAGEFNDFARFMPQLIASASNMHISFQDTAGLFAYMTAKGQNAADSAMLMQNAFTALQKNDVLKGLEGKGVKIFNAEGERRNIQSVFLDLTKQLSGLTDKQKTSFFIDVGLNDAQAKNAFSVLTADADKFKEVMNSVNNALGETDKQLAATTNHARSWGDIGDELKSWGVTIGEFILPAVDMWVSGVSEMAHDIKNLFSGDDYTAELHKKLAGDAANKLTQQKIRQDMSAGGAYQDESKFYNDTYNKFIKQLEGKNDIVKGENGAMKNAFGSNHNAKNPFGKTEELSTTSKLKEGMDSISGGGKQHRNVIVNITKLVENVNIHASTVKESGTDLTRQIEEIVLRAIQGSETALGNS